MQFPHMVYYDNTLSKTVLVFKDHREYVPVKPVVYFNDIVMHFASSYEGRVEAYSLRKLLEIRNKAEQTVALDDVHAAEIKEYLDLLDLTREIDVLHLPDVSTKSSRVCVAQPGLPMRRRMR